MIFTFISTRLIQLTRRTYQYKCNRLTSYVYNSTNDNTTRDSPTIRKPMYRSTPDKKGYIYDIFTELWEESSAYNQVPHLFRYFDWALSLRVLWRYKNKIHLKNWLWIAWPHISSTHCQKCVYIYIFRILILKMPHKDHLLMLDCAIVLNTFFHLSVLYETVQRKVQLTVGRKWNASCTETLTAH